MMDCNEFLLLIPEFASEIQVHPKAHEILEHLRRCPNCQLAYYDACLAVNSLKAVQMKDIVGTKDDEQM